MHKHVQASFNAGFYFRYRSHPLKRVLRYEILEIFQKVIILIVSDSGTFNIVRHRSLSVFYQELRLRPRNLGIIKPRIIPPNKTNAPAINHSRCERSFKE